MKICDYHKDTIRTSLAALGQDVRLSTGPRNPAFTCEAMLMAEALRQEPSLADAGPDTCPICILLVPSWIGKAAQAVANMKETIQ